MLEETRGLYLISLNVIRLFNLINIMGFDHQTSYNTLQYIYQYPHHNVQSTLKIIEFFNS